MNREQIEIKVTKLIEDIESQTRRRTQLEEELCETSIVVEELEYLLSEWLSELELCNG